jgi:hypothetical protein
VLLFFVLLLVLLIKFLGIVPHPNGRENKTYSTYVRAELFHTRDQEWRSKTVKVKDVPGVGADVMWNETFKWEFLDDPFAFIRFRQYLEPPRSVLIRPTLEQIHCDGR